MSEAPEFELRLLATEDAKALYTLFKENKDSFKTYFPQTYKQTKTIKASKALIEETLNMAECKSAFYFGLHTVIHPELAGLIILKEVDHEHHEGEIAYCMAKRFRGRGWVSQAVKQVADFGYINHQIQTYKIITHSSNEKSILVAERNGFTWHCTLENEFKPLQGKAQDMELYILKK